MFAASTLLAPPVNAAAGDGRFTPHPSLVPESPETGYPILLDTPTYISQSPNCPNGCTNHRQTYAVDMVGQYIISGGDFMNIELQNRNTISQPYLAIFDSTTKQLVCSDLDVNNEVLAIAPGPLPRTAIIGGRFTIVNGADGVDRTRSHLAMIHLDTCQVDTVWSGGSLDSKVTEIAVSGNRLFIGGDFNHVAGNNIEKLAELNYLTGAVNTNFSFTFEGEVGRAIVGLEASPDGTRLAIVHRTTSINGQSMRGSAVFNIANPSAPTLTNHRMSTSVKAFSYYFDIQKGAISPDFSRIGIVQGTLTISDYVTLLPTAEASGQLSWQHSMRDSSFGIAISNNAVYVAGHFCKIAEGPGPTQILARNTGPSSCTGSRDFADGAWRTQLAALSISDGTPLNWNPGNDSGRGGTALTVVSRGLLSGFDGEVTNNVRTGTTAFFDFGAPNDPRSDQTCTVVVNGLDVELSWDAVPGIDSYNVRRNAAAIASPGNTLTYTDTPPAGTHTYYIRTDLNGARWDTTCNPTITIDGGNPGAQTCQATNNGDGSITLDWTAIPGEKTYIVRRNGRWLTTPGNTLTFTDTNYSAGDSYIIRSSINGTTTNTTCNPTITIDGGNPGAQTCQATNNGDGSITLDWTTSSAATAAGSPRPATR